MRNNEEIIADIKACIADRIQPFVADDGGFCEFIAFDNGTVTVHMGGSCSGCASSAVTLKHGIENMLMHFVPEVSAVVADSTMQMVDPFVTFGDWQQPNDNT